MNQVITILLVNSDGATAAELNTEFTTANITDYAYEPESQGTAPKSWPTLQTMIDDGKRLVVFVASVTTSESYPYLMDEFAYVWENPYDTNSASNFSCEVDRPSTYSTPTAALSANLLPLMNHFLYSSDLAKFDIDYPNSSYVGTTNAASGGTGNLGDTASTCKKEWGGRQPSFVLVDFFNRGPAIDAVDSLNGVTDPVGRKSVSESATGGASSSSSVYKGLVDLAESARSGSKVTMGNWIWAGGNWGNLLGGGISF